MGLFDFLKRPDIASRKPDINESVKEYRSISGAVLLDVRSPQEYREGHIPGSKNVPLQRLGDVSRVAPDQDAPLFVYCYSGSRSGQAVSMLGGMGYSNARNIGGIASYSGEMEY